MCVKFKIIDSEVKVKMLTDRQAMEEDRSQLSPTWALQMSLKRQFLKKRPSRKLRPKQMF